MISQLLVFYITYYNTCTVILLNTNVYKCTTLTSSNKTEITLEIKNIFIMVTIKYVENMECILHVHHILKTFTM